MNTDTTMHANDLTQLSSREQLSALMDGALPPDETRFLLRRLRHDASLAECWERWRLTGEVMRGLAPTQRLPADFATRVGAALHGKVAPPVQLKGTGTSAWLRWGGGAAMAASLAVAALVSRPPAGDGSAPPAASMAANSTAVPALVQPASAGAARETQAIATAGALAVSSAGRALYRSQEVGSAARPKVASARSSRVAVAQPVATSAAADSLPLVQQPDIATRPWPRSVLPQYASDGLTVGFGNQGSAVYNPFPVQAAITTVPANAGDRDATQPQPQAAPPRTDGIDGPQPKP